jgi:hypothetical protein
MTDYSETARKETPEHPMSGAEFQRAVGAELDSWTDQMLASASREGHKLEREWLRSWLSDVMDAARKQVPTVVIAKEA